MNTTIWDKIAGFLSLCCIGVAAALLVSVCAYCYPGIGSFGGKLFFGKEDGPVRAAFSVLTESLEEGNSIRDSFERSYEVFLGTED